MPKASVQNPIAIADTKLGKAGLGWVLDNVVEITRATRERAGVNDILIYYWVIEPGKAHGVGRARGPALEDLKEAYPKAMELWDGLSTPPAHPDHVSIVVFDEASKELFTLRLTLADCRNTGMVN